MAQERSPGLCTRGSLSAIFAHAGEEVSAVAAGQNSEEGLDVLIGPRVAVAVEVGRAVARCRGAVPGDAGEEGFDVLVGAGVAVAVEVGRAAGAFARDGHCRLAGVAGVS